jgi:flagellar hook-associated protein 3 FlgL
MRITQRMMTDNAIRYMDENLQRLHALQEKASSGKLWQRPSDDPNAVTAALTLRSNLETLQGYLDTTYMTDDWMSANDFALKQALDLATRVKTLALSGSTDSVGPQERLGIAAEVDVLLQQAVDIANTNHKENYLFSGFQVNTPPFELINNDGDPFYDAVGYNGDAGVIIRHLGPDQTITQNLNGTVVFSPFHAAIIQARDALLANDVAGVGQSVQELQDAISVMSAASTTNGARQRQVRTIGERIERTQIEIKSLLSKKEDANMAEVIANLRHQETVYETVLEVSNRAISSLSLFDLLS